jgi:hypothetical protein
LIRAGAAVFVLYGLMFAIGAAQLLRPVLAAGLTAVAAAGGAVLYRYRERDSTAASVGEEPTPPNPENQPENRPE